MPYGDKTRKAAQVPSEIKKYNLILLGMETLWAEKTSAKMILRSMD